MTLLDMDIWSSTPFLRPSSAFDGDIYADAVFQVLHDRGLDRLSVTAIAAVMGVSPAAVLQRHPRKEVFLLVVSAFSERWLDWSYPNRAHLPGRLPETDIDRHGVRVWHSLSELARGAAAGGDDQMLDQLIWVREQERAQVARVLDRLFDHEIDTREVEPREVNLTLMLLDGLRRELVAPNPCLSPEEAVDILSREMTRLRSSTRPCG